jgi:hypothetical protein
MSRTLCLVSRTFDVGRPGRVAQQKDPPNLFKTGGNGGYKYEPVPQHQLERLGGLNGTRTTYQRLRNAQIGYPTAQLLQLVWPNRK